MNFLLLKFWTFVYNLENKIVTKAKTIMVIPSFYVLFCGWAEGTSVITALKHKALPEISFANCIKPLFAMSFLLKLEINATTNFDQLELRRVKSHDHTTKTNR